MANESSQEKPQKVATTIHEQIGILRERGLVINNESYAEKFLGKIAYYKFSGYYRQFYKKDKYEEFHDDLKFEEVANLYLFDSELRLLLFELMREIEITFKTRLANDLACDYGATTWSDEKNFNNNSFIERNSGIEFTYHEKMKSELERKLKRAGEEPFIQHHIQQYGGKFPIWVVMEVADFGDASKLFKNLKDEIKQEFKIRYYPGVSYQKLESWMEQFVKCRNICSHHGRIIRKENFKIRKNNLMKKHDASGLFNLLIAAKIVINDFEVWTKFLSKLNVLINEFNINVDFLNIPSNWQEILQ